MTLLPAGAGHSPSPGPRLNCLEPMKSTFSPGASPSAVALLCLAACAPLHAIVPKAWFKADSLALSNGAQIALWADSSGNGNVAQAGASAPTFATNAFNGAPVVRFGGTHTLVFPRPVENDFTMVVLFKAATAAGTSDNFYDGSALVSCERGSSVNDFAMSLKGSGGRVLMGTGNPDVTARSEIGYLDNNPHVATFTRVRSTGTLKNYVDRTLWETSTGGTQALNVYPQLVIGGHPNASGTSLYLNGDIAEILVYDIALNDTQAFALEDSLRGKYGLASGTVPRIPENVATQGNRITWSESAGATTYQVFRSNSAGGTFTRIAQNLTGGVHVDATAVGGQIYYYQVKAGNPVGLSGASATVEGTTLLLPAGGPVVINEIHYNGLNNTLRSDFIELFNYSDSARDLTGWRLSSGVDYVFPSGTVIPAGGYLVIAENPAAIQSLWGVTALGPYEKSLSSGGETIRLRNAADAIVTEVTYNSGFPWPCAANGEGASAELVNPLLDASKGSSWRASVTPATELTGEVASPGARNLQFSANPAPNIEEVSHSPSQPTSGNPVVVTARLSDSDGIASAVLSVQTVNPGSYIPAYLPLPIVNNRIDTSQGRPANPDFEHPARWTNYTMNDNGTGGDAVAGDGVYSATIPAKENRVLVRYRVTAVDGAGKSVRAPFADDASKNFAYFVYNGVPDYQGIPSSTLTSLPVYQFITRERDYDQCVAYNSSDRLSGYTLGWNFENWEAAMVFDGKVYDHIRYRLHGGNGRYAFSGKRGFRFFFNDGYLFQNRGNDGKLMPTKWKSITTENCWENRGTLTYCLNEMVNFDLWNKIGIPAPLANWGHFRTVTTSAEQASRTVGDFWGLIMIHEDYNGDFLDAHSLEKGNVYKLTRDSTNGASQQRYQAPDAVPDSSDHANIYSNMIPSQNEAFVRRYVNITKWSYYHALCHAVRHYDYWPTGDNNGAYYFEPDYTDQSTPRLGKLWILPNDVDATWGPTWNEGKDRVWSAIFESGGKPGIYPEYFNAVREVRDLLWQQDQINPLLDEYAAVIAPFIPADSLRWKNAPAAFGNYDGLGGAGYTSLAALVADMKKFAWTGGSWPGGSVGAGGSAALMDSLQLGVTNSEGSTMPATPTMTYQGPAGYPANELTFSTTAFSDPQGALTFAAIQWRVAEVTDSSAPAYDAADKFKLEWTASYDSGPVAGFTNSFTFPASGCEPGHAYRARVRHKDATGRWSHWSAPVQFIAGESTNVVSIQPTELLYRPTPLTAAETTAGFTDRDQFEYLEIRNVGTNAADLSGCYFEKGLTFTFPPGSILAPGASTLVVRSAAAVNFRFGSGRPIAGEFGGGLSNSGETLQLVNPGGDIILFDFTYDDVAPWPPEALGAGYSLVMKNPVPETNPSLSSNWRLSARPGGAPGYGDSTSYSKWSTARSVTGGPNEDDDRDGLSNALEYALLGDPGAFTAVPAGQIQSLTVESLPGRYLVTSFRKQLDATDLSYQVEFSGNLGSWNGSPVLMSTSDHYDGTVTETWRSSQPVDGQGFLRVKIGPPP